MILTNVYSLLLWHEASEFLVKLIYRNKLVKYLHWGLNKSTFESLNLYKCSNAMKHLSAWVSVYANKFIFIVQGDWENLTGNINIFDLCLCHSGQMPEQSLRYFPVPHPTHISFLVMCFSVINMWLSSNCFILLHSSTKLALGHQEACKQQTVSYW